jgi:hypothetical protein
LGSISGGRTLGTFEQSKPGDVVRFAMGSSAALGIVVRAGGDQGTQVGLLKGGYHDMPHLQVRSSKDTCVNYGSDWVLAPTESDEAQPTHDGPGRRAGILALSARGWLMNFATSGVDHFGRFNWEWRDLASFEPVEHPGETVYYDRWTLWPSETERLLPNAQCLLDYTAQEQVGHLQR